jgi:D-xylose transport system ATP-binding protein
MDEPTAALGVEETRIVYDLARRLRDQGLPIIIISHNINEIFNLADRFAILKNGRLVGVKEKKAISEDDVVAMIVSGKTAVAR